MPGAEVDEFVAINIPFAAPLCAVHVEGKGTDETGIVVDAARDQLAGSLPERPGARELGGILLEDCGHGCSPFVRITMRRIRCLAKVMRIMNLEE
jgi:hypothetical protein